LWEAIYILQYSNMTSPLSHITNAAMNSATPPQSMRDATHKTPNYSQDSADEDFEDAPSSPFIADVPDITERENISPIKLSKPSPGLVDRGPASPLKILKSRATPSPMKGVISDRNPRKLSSPEKRFPVKVSVSAEQQRPVSQEQTLTINEVLRDNEGLTKAIQILEDEDSVLEYGDSRTESHHFNERMLSLGDEDAEHECFADDTAFSNFSAVPAKFAATSQTPRRPEPETPGTARRSSEDDFDASPTPRRWQGDVHVSSENNSGNTTNLILDFTEQFNSLSGFGQPSPIRRSRLSPSKTTPDLLSYTQSARTPSPSKQRQQQIHSPTARMSNLLDFDIPPAPTPRSMPSITPRELESLKSGFLSEISSLKASLSGKEAEVQSLKTAVGDAEKRVGESMEQVREERNLKEQLAIEREGWERRGREMELVLRNVKEEIVHGEREREELEGRLDECEKRREAAEMMAQEAESKMAGMRAGSASMSDSGGEEKKTSGSTGREVEIAVEKVARELHTLYKSKHETKVAALKKSYEGRWDRKVKDLEARLDDMTRENEDLRLGGNATMSGVVPMMPDVTEELKMQAANDAKNNKELEARLEGLSEEMRSIKQDNEDLRLQLEQERVEKGELVAACDELLSLQDATPPTNPNVSSGVENLRGSVSRASGLRAPNYSSAVGSSTPAGSRIAKIDKSRSGSAQGMRPGSGMGSRSGIMSSIEKMGNYKGRAD